MKIAVCGKGGVGKTFVAAALARALTRQGYTTIAIDADPSPNLALTLGISEKEAGEIVPVSENAALIKSKTGTGYAGVYNLNVSVDDVIKKFAVKTPAGVNLLVMGTVKLMGSGCTCPANSVIRALLRHLVVDRDEAVVLDMEAGIEHLGRGTAESVDAMVVVSDANRKSLNIAGKIARMALDAGIRKVVLLGNKLGNSSEKKRILAYADEHALLVLGFIPFDRSVADAGIAGESVLELKKSMALMTIDRLAKKIIRNDPVPPGKGERTTKESVS